MTTLANTLIARIAETYMAEPLIARTITAGAIVVVGGTLITAWLYVVALILT